MYKKQTDQHPTKKLLHGDVTEFVIQPLLPCEKVFMIAVAACNFVGWGKHTPWKIEGITTRRGWIEGGEGDVVDCGIIDFLCVHTSCTWG